jgi:hypothetical protein
MANAKDTFYYFAQVQRFAPSDEIVGTNIL